MAHLFQYPHLIALMIAFVFADIACAMTGNLARKFGAVDVPGVLPYKVQKESIPFVGGFAILIGFIGSLVVSIDWDILLSSDIQTIIGDRHTKVAIATVLGGSVVAVLGLVDDFKSIHAVVKLVILMALTAVLAQMGLVVNLVGSEFVNWLITLLWIVGVISAFNAIDNTDGVAGGTAASAAFWVFLVGWGTSVESSQWSLSFLGVALFGSTLGFLRHNRPPARIYLGNGGSFLLGFLVAVATIHAGWTRDPISSSLVPIMLLAYPIFDITYTVLMRWKAGIVRNPIEAVVVSGRDHTAHRLAAIGFPPWGVLLVVLLLNGAGGFAGYMVVRHQLEGESVLLLAGACLVMYSIFGWVIRNAVDLRSPRACISNRRETRKVV